MIAFLRAFWYDETGAPSMARGLLSGSTLFLMAITVADMMGAEVGEHVYDNWFDYLMLIVGWAGGPRVMTAVAPALAARFSKVRGAFGSYTSSGSYGPVPPDEVVPPAKVFEDEP